MGKAAGGIKIQCSKVGNTMEQLFCAWRGHIIKIEVIIGTIRILEEGTTLRDDRNRDKYNRGDRRIFKDKDRSYDGGRNRDRDKRGIFSRNRRDSGSRNEGKSTSRNKVKREGVISIENWDIL